MRVYGECDIFDVSAHLQCQYGFCDQFTGISPYHAGTDYLVCFFIEQYLGDAFVATDT